MGHMSLAHATAEPSPALGVYVLTYRKKEITAFSRGVSGSEYGVSNCANKHQKAKSICHTILHVGFGERFSNQSMAVYAVLVPPR